jgi:hypothetical protein
MCPGNYLHHRRALLGADIQGLLACQKGAGSLTADTMPPTLQCGGKRSATPLCVARLVALLLG